MAVLFDTHAHYFDARFDGDREAAIDAVFRGSEVGYILNAGTNPGTSAACIALAERYAGMYAAVGMHPEDCSTYFDFDAELDGIRRMLAHPKAVAIGEIGLDYHWEPRDEEYQKKWFRAQMALARETGYPVIIHDRDAHGDTMDIIREFDGVTGILHSYSGSAEMIRELVRRGYYISFSGVITFKNASRILEAVRAVPRDRLLLETDCPYLAPHPMRGRRNDSSLMVYTAEKAAEVRGEDFSELCRYTTENARRIYRI